MGEFGKAIVALILAILVVIEQLTGWSAADNGITEEWITIVLTLLIPVAVWLVPNRPSRHL